MGFETFNNPRENVNLERVAQEELTKIDKEKIAKSREELEQEENFAAIDKNFGIDPDSEKKDKSEDILLEQKLNFRVNNALKDLRELQEGIYTGPEGIEEKEKNIKKRLHEAEQELLEFEKRRRN